MRTVLQAVSQIFDSVKIFKTLLISCEYPYCQNVLGNGVLIMHMDKNSLFP